MARSEKFYRETLEDALQMEERLEKERLIHETNAIITYIEMDLMEKEGRL